MNAPETPHLPDAQVFLSGKDGVKPHHYKAEDLRRFVAGFEETPLAPKSSETLVQLGEVMEKPHWANAHDAAHEALISTRRLLADPAHELTAHADTIESIFKARAPQAEHLRMVKHPTLQELLKPLGTYLEEFGGFVTGWVSLTPARMKPKGDDAITPALHRTNVRAAAEALKTTNPEAVIPECGDVHCTVDHTGGGSSHPTSTILPEPHDHSGHVHGPGCDHHHTAPASTISEGHIPSGSHSCDTGCSHAPANPTFSSSHYHGDMPCSHSHPHVSSGSCGHLHHEPHLPKGKSNAVVWLAVAGAVGVGAYLINEYGKNPEKKKTTLSKPGDWQRRMEPPAQPVAKAL